MEIKVYIKKKIIDYFNMNNKNSQYQFDEKEKAKKILNEENINFVFQSLCQSNKDTNDDDFDCISNYNFQDNQLIEEDFFSNLKKKRGRMKKTETQFEDHKERHSRYERDNILKKIKTHFHEYIINYINSFLELYNINIRFIKFAEMFQNDITITTNKLLLDVKMSDILKTIHSYRNKKEKNKIAYEKLKDNENINFLFSKTYVDYYILFVKSNYAKELIKKQKQIQKKIEKVMGNFIEYYRRKKPKIQNKYKNNRSELYKLLFKLKSIS